MKKIAALFFAFCAVALMLSSCASLGVSSKGASCFVGKKEKALAKYFGYEGEVLIDNVEDEDFDKMAYFSNKSIVAYMDWSKTTYTKSRRYSDISDFEFIQMSDGCYVAMGNSHYEQRYRPGSKQNIYVAGRGYIQQADSAQVYQVHRNDNAAISAWINQFNSNVRYYGAASAGRDDAIFNSGDVGYRYFIYSVDRSPATLGGEYATIYDYSLQQVDIYMDARTQSDTQVAYSYSIPSDVYYAADRRTAISKDEALANVSYYASREYALRKETSGLALVAFIKDGVVDKIVEDPNAESDLVIAAIGNSFGWVNEILLFGANPDIQDADGWTALMWAASNGNAEIARLLVRNGANPNIQDADGQTALMRAVFRDENEIVRVLLENGANPNTQDGYGNTALMYATIKGDAKIAALLLDAGANPNIQEATGWTALMDAVVNENAEIVRLLLDAGANPFLQEYDYGITPMDAAVDGGNAEIIRMLKAAR